jgi:hypothetical protein
MMDDELKKQDAKVKKLNCCLEKIISSQSYVIHTFGF